MEVVIVRTEDELAECLAIRREVFMDEQGVSEEEEIDSEDVVGVGHHLFIRNDVGAAVATARYKPYDDHTAKIQRVAVRKAYRSFGYGRLVMQAIEDYAARDGYQSAVLDAQCHAQAFYTRLGYEVVSPEPFYDAGILHVRMKKVLTPVSSAK